MRHLPSIEALSDVDDRRLLAELEVCRLLDRLSQAHALVERAKLLLTTIVEPSLCSAAPQGPLDVLDSLEGANSGPMSRDNRREHLNKH